MILKGSQRAGAKQLANHLLRGEENEHIEVHEVSGFTSDKAESAFQEMQAISKGTRCTQFMFSVSLSPPEKENVSVEVFENAIDTIGKKLGLENQPRIVVFHEKEGRRHAHCVWSRIDAEQMKAVNLSHYKLKLRDIAKELYLEHGWQLPNGFIDSKERNPLNFSLAEWQQAKRHGDDPKVIKQLFQECWAASDSKQAFIKALEERGYTLAQGDRRGYVAVDYRGEVYSLSRQTGVKTKELEARFGDSKHLPTVDQVKVQLAERLTPALQKHIQEVQEQARRQAIPILQARQEMVKRHREERAQMDAFLAKRHAGEQHARAARLSKGLKGIWHRITGQYQRIRTQNERELQECQKRDRDQRQLVIEHQLQERRILQKQIVSIRQRQQEDKQFLKEHIAHYGKLAKQQEKAGMHSIAQEQSRERDKQKSRSVSRSKSKEHGIT
jgi:hypothetical protein